MTRAARWLAYLPAIAWYVFIFWLSSQPKLPGPDGVLLEFIWFKTAHALFYAILTTMTWNATITVFQPKKDDRLVMLGVFILIVILAALDELHQGFVPGRHMRTRDVFIDSLASATALLVNTRYNRRKQYSGM